MPLEIEIKLSVETHRAVMARLRHLHATHKRMVREINMFFDRPDRSLLKGDSALRVRLEQPLPARKQSSKTSRHKSATALLTFKGPPRATSLRSHQAYDLTVTPADQLIPLLNALGFQQTMVFEKNRDSWEYARCKIELDTLPHFGRFVEIEGPSERAVRAVQKKLNLEHLPGVKPSYARMVGKHLASHRTRRREFRF